VRAGRSTKPALPVWTAREPDRAITLWEDTTRATALKVPGGPDDQHGEGWDHDLARLTVAAVGSDAGADLWVRSARSQNQ
jgi:hypothetical protein